MQSLNIEIKIPPEYVVISQDEYRKLLDHQLTGQQWSMNDLKEWTDRSANWLKEKILYPHREELDIQKGGFVYYPTSQGDTWRFGAKRMAEWLEENLERVL